MLAPNSRSGRSFGATVTTCPPEVIETDASDALPAGEEAGRVVTAPGSVGEDPAIKRVFQLGTAELIGASERSMQLRLACSAYERCLM